MIETWRLLELAQTPEDEKYIAEIIATLDNYEYLKTKLHKCKCQDSTMYIEDICIKCGGVDPKDPAVFTWRW